MYVFIYIFTYLFIYLYIYIYMYMYILILTFFWRIFYSASTMLGACLGTSPTIVYVESAAGMYTDTCIYRFIINLHLYT